MNPTFALFFGYLQDTIPFGYTRYQFQNGLSKWCIKNDDFSWENLYFAANSLPVTDAAILNEIGKI